MSVDSKKRIYMLILNFNAASLFSRNPQGPAKKLKHYLDSNGLVAEPAFTPDRYETLEKHITHPICEYDDREKQRIRAGAMMSSERLIRVYSKNKVDGGKSVEMLCHFRNDATIRGVVAYLVDQQTEDFETDLFTLTKRYIPSNKGEVEGWINKAYKQNQP